MEKEKYELKVYVAGITPDNQAAIVNFKKQLEKSLGADAYSLLVVDVLENPELAEMEKIMATPTVVRLMPAPIKKLIMDLGNSKSMLISLDLLKNK